MPEGVYLSQLYPYKRSSYSHTDIAIQWKNIAIYRNTFFLYHDTPSDEYIFVIPTFLSVLSGMSWIWGVCITVVVLSRAIFGKSIVVSLFNIDCTSFLIYVISGSGCWCPPVFSNCAKSLNFLSESMRFFLTASTGMGFSATVWMGFSATVWIGFSATVWMGFSCISFTGMGFSVTAAATDE